MATVPARTVWASAFVGRCPQVRLPLYSHNDYRGERPLSDAVAAGFRGVEVDVFLVKGVLRPGHDSEEAARAPTFEDQYLRPLTASIADCEPSATKDTPPFLLLLEIKEHSRATYDSVFAVLSRYPSAFAGSDGDRSAPVEIVFVGWMPPRERAFAAKAQALSQRQYRMQNPSDTLLDLGGAGTWPIRLISVDYGKTIGRWWTRPRGRRQWYPALSAVKHRYPRLLLRAHNVPADAAVITRLLAADVDLVGATNVRQFARLLEDVGTATHD